MRRRWKAEPVNECALQGSTAVIAVSGAAALGKTTFFRGLAEYIRFRGVSVGHVELDGFLLDRVARKETNLASVSNFKKRSSVFKTSKTAFEQLISYAFSCIESLRGNSIHLIIIVQSPENGKCRLYEPIYCPSNGLRIPSSPLIQYLC